MANARMCEDVKAQIIDLFVCLAGLNSSMFYLRLPVVLPKCELEL